LTLAAAAVLAMVPGCGDDGSDPAASDEQVRRSTGVSLVEGVDVAVSAIDNTFRPESLTVQAGTTVVFTNDGRSEHNVLTVEGEGWGVETTDFLPGDEYRHRFTEPGTYHYYCSLHGTETKGMVGTIVVTG
jgi:plastocyanin